jgi:hypothetical protein
MWYLSQPFGDTLPDDLKQDLIAFARRPMTIGAYEKRKSGATPFSSLPPDGFMALPYHGGMVFHWEGNKFINFRAGCQMKRVGEIKTGFIP